MCPPNNTSIEVVSKDGPVDFNVMMQEGVKALTKVLADHLQDHPDYLKQQSMKLVFNNDVGKSGINEKATGSSEKDAEQVTAIKSARDEEIEKTDLENNSNYHVCKELPSQTPESSSSCSPSKNKQSSPVAQASEFDCEEGELVFDYGEQDLMSLPGEFGDSIKRMVASSMAQDPSGRHSNINIDLDVDDTLSDNNNSPEPSSFTDQPSQKHRGCRHGGDGNREHDFEYPHHPKVAPDFASLITYDQPLCMFCEYYFVFGEPPKNMIKWFQRTGGRDASAHCRSYQRHKNSNQR
ncbi:LAQU0S05e03796g1_1 [Lachancea quebecensis]|uniref:Protein IBD2 n=1 Tax=Lachancea quebecensis TaxID=1654605 RepID=A0A0P1KTM4_9SACH|nr:LAQU0S05e03796g1_1 [Lachancea quebecensis]